MKKFYFIVLLLLIGTSTTFSQTTAPADSMVYVCPPCNGSCDQLQFDKPGVCPHCGMALVKMSLSDFKKLLAAKPITIAFYLQDGVEVLDFAGPMEVFITAGFNVITVSKTYKPIRSKTVLFITPDYTIADAPKSDILVVFGGPTQPTIDDPEVMAWLKAQISSDKYVMSVCTGAFILGKTGILDNLTATTFHTAIGDLAKAYPKTKVLANTRFVDNGTVITTAGISAGIDGALHLVEKLRGRPYAKSVAETIEYDKWVPDNGLIVKTN
ncbi:DJ-1/PfpI family protein [Mucilaginibacter frigoritolerans]|uniref:DJ-1/PfpI family protein n=1 Tax=Mucilaginibacter frigoritolerans TaxID=652788 RepID=A0A562TRY3_9SPHI|nr:DJ-1/PfpI family protein [Mucilaginibacter frigoritolerans]TWI95964.1 DJ-1/PfpI family protein [Mucilaginibacter frigoritolerans]